MSNANATAQSKDLVYLPTRLGSDRTEHTRRQFECNGDSSPTTFQVVALLAILGPMIPLPKPRGFWDYALFALAMTGALVLLF